MRAWCYEPGIKNHSILHEIAFKSMDAYKTYWNAIIIAQNRNNNITP